MSQRFSTDLSGFLSGKSGAVSSKESVVYVEVGSKSIEPQIAREGVPLKPIPINPDVFDDFFGGTPIVTHKVVSQSVPPGTSVPQGTTVHIQLAVPGRIPVGVVQGVITQLAEQSIQDVYTTYIEGNTQMNRVLARTAESGVLSATDEAFVMQEFEERGITLSEEPGNDVGSALHTLQAVKTFG